ncbi:MAG: glycerol-3-phosphate acyltransferase [Clostridia bacterium]|nr:glycerol-3-phosphate acyltransferase [Clostridia bacterium]
MKELALTQVWWQFLLIAVACYLIGCFNFAKLISAIKRQDITKMGSGNPGTMNMTREFGFGVGVLTFLCDALKSGIPLLIGHFLYRGFVFAGTEVLISDFIRYFCVLFVIVGHIYPVTMGFRGGKGIASTMGAFWFSLSCDNLWWILGGGLIALFLVGFIKTTKMGSLGSLIGVSGCTVIQMIIFLMRYGNTQFNAYLVGLYMVLLAINFLTWWAHRANILRLLAGEEHRTTRKRKK